MLVQTILKSVEKKKERQGIPQSTFLLYFTEESHNSLEQHDEDVYMMTEVSFLGELAIELNINKKQAIKLPTGNTWNTLKDASFSQTYPFTIG